MMPWNFIKVTKRCAAWMIRSEAAVPGLWFRWTVLAECNKDPGAPHLGYFSAAAVFMWLAKNDFLLKSKLDWTEKDCQPHIPVWKLNNNIEMKADWEDLAYGKHSWWEAVKEWLGMMAMIVPFAVKQVALDLWPFGKNTPTDTDLH